MQRQVLVIQRVQRTVDVPLVQYIDRIVDVPVVKQRQALHIQTVQKTLEVPQIQRLHRAVHVPVETSQERVQQHTRGVLNISHSSLWPSARRILSARPMKCPRSLLQFPRRTPIQMVPREG